jgi:ABC-2 type transport system permease protein
MNRAIFIETMRRHWRGMLFWGIGIGLLAAVQALILQDVTALEQIAELMETLPPFFVQAFADGDAAYMATPEGYLAARFFSLALLIFAAYTIGVGMQVTANEEDRGQMDILLSLPVTRTTLVLGKTIAFLLMTVSVLLLTLMLLLVGLTASPVPIDTGRLIVGTLNILPAAWCLLAFTVFLGGVIGDRGRVLLIAALFVIGGYFVDVLAVAAPDSPFGVLNALSIFRYYDGVAVVRDGLSWGNIALLLTVTVALIAGGIAAFNRRDVGV